MQSSLPTDAAVFANASSAKIATSEATTGETDEVPTPAAPQMMIEIPVNSKTLASHLGRSPGYVAAMKSGGYKFTHGTRTLLSDALQWLADHPEFRATGYRRNAPGFVKRKKPAR